MCDSPTPATRTPAPADEPPDDRDLIAALKAGEPDAPRQLIDRFGAIVFSLCLRMLRHRQDAEDVMQESFLRALRGMRGFRDDRAFRPWLLGIAANRCRTALGKRARRRTFNAEIVDRPDPRRAGDTDDLAAEINRALDQLRPEYRLVFILYHEQGLLYEEIGAALERPIGTIKTWLHRARAELAETLTRRGYEP